MNFKHFTLLMAIPVSIILGFMIFYALLSTTGQEIVLEVVEPIDPLDLFRGNFVALGYDIGTLDTNVVFTHETFDSDDRVFVVLSKKKEFWAADAVRVEKPSLDNHEVCLRGIVRSVDRNEITVEYGLESFFVPLEQAKRIEDARRDGDVSAMIRVDRFCNSVLRALNVGDETVRTR